MRDQTTKEILWTKSFRRMSRASTYRTGIPGAEMADFSEAEMADLLDTFAAFLSERMQGALLEDIEQDRAAS